MAYQAVDKTTERTTEASAMSVQTTSETSEYSSARTCRSLPQRRRRSSSLPNLPSQQSSLLAEGSPRIDRSCSGETLTSPTSEDLYSGETLVGDPEEEEEQDPEQDPAQTSQLASEDTPITIYTDWTVEHVPASAVNSPVPCRTATAIGPTMTAADATIPITPLTALHSHPVFPPASPPTPPDTAPATQRRGRPIRRPTFDLPSNDEDEQEEVTRAREQAEADRQFQVMTSAPFYPAAVNAASRRCGWEGSGVDC